MARSFHVTAPSMRHCDHLYLVVLAVLIPARRRDQPTATVYSGCSVPRPASSSPASSWCASTRSLPFMVAAPPAAGRGRRVDRRRTMMAALFCCVTVERRNLVSVMSWSLVPAFLGPLIGPPLGGFIVSYLDWRWIFYLNVPIGLLGFGPYGARPGSPIDTQRGRPRRASISSKVRACAVPRWACLGVRASEDVPGENTLPCSKMYVADLLRGVGASSPAQGYLWHARQQCLHREWSGGLPAAQSDSFRLSVVEPVR